MQFPSTSSTTSSSSPRSASPLSRGLSLPRGWCVGRAHSTPRRQYYQTELGHSHIQRRHEAMSQQAIVDVKVDVPYCVLSKTSNVIRHYLSVQLCAIMSLRLRVRTFSSPQLSITYSICHSVSSPWYQLFDLPMVSSEAEVPASASAALAPTSHQRVSLRRHRHEKNGGFRVRRRRGRRRRRR